MGEIGTAFGGVPMPDPLAQFLGRVLAWSAADPPDSYVNIHAWTPKADPRVEYRRKGGGRAYASMVEYGQLTQFLWQCNQAGDEVFFCLSTRSGFNGMDAKGNRKANRSKKAGNLPVRLKAFVLDLDVKDKGYASQRAALAALLPVFDGWGIKPTIVDSGGGLHAYITLPEGIAVAVWQSLANALIEAARQAGLKFDVGVTKDSARVLRLPTSFNRKDPANPKLCRLLVLGEDTPLAHVENILRPYMGIVAAAPRANGHAPQVDLSFLPPRAPITGPEAERARAEVERLRVVTSVDLLLDACPVVKDSDWRGGDGDREPLWFELAKLCHYVEQGQDFFHDLSSKDPRYDEEQTDAKYAAAEPQGWPACSTIEAASDDAARLCRTCPHRGKGLSPIHAATRGDPPGEASSGQVNGHVNGHALSAAAFATPGGPPTAPIWVPPGYRLDVNNFLWTPENELAFNTPIHYVNAVYEDQRQLVEFIIDRGTTDVDPTGHFFIEASTTASRAKFAEAAAGYGLHINHQTDKGRRVEQDLLSQIRLQRTAVTYKRCGWSDEGFVYGGQIHTAEGPRPTSSRDPDIGPHGTLEAWKAVVDRYVGHGLVDMEMFIASAFAAPLLRFTSVDGGIIFTRSVNSGYGKSAATFIAASVWYRKNIVIEKGTANFVLDRLATLNNLPVYFDELVPASANAKAFADLIKAVSSGTEPGRLSRSSKAIPQRHSCTMLGANANVSLIEIARTPDSNAQAARVLEYEMSDAFTKRPKDFGDTAIHRMALNENCGTAGTVYAEFLGRHKDAIASLVADELRYWQQRMQAGDAERFWCCNAAALMVGATIAKKLNLMNFDIAGMRVWLRNWFLSQRAELTEMGTNADDPTVQLHRLYDFLNDKIRNRIITDTMPKKGSGKCVLQNGHYITNSNEFVARIASNDKRIWISETKLETWCKHPSRGYSYGRMKHALMKAGYCERHRAGRNIGAGTDYHTAKEVVLDFDLQDPRLQFFISDE